MTGDGAVPAPSFSRVCALACSNADRRLALDSADAIRFTTVSTRLGSSKTLPSNAVIDCAAAATALARVGTGDAGAWCPDAVRAGFVTVTVTTDAAVVRPRRCDAGSDREPDPHQHERRRDLDGNAPRRASPAANPIDADVAAGHLSAPSVRGSRRS